MGYDYSLGFLKKHVELVRKLQQVASTGELLVYESTDWDEIKRKQKLVNEVLANMSRNVEGSEDIRAVLRAWTAFKDESTYQLFIGQPNHKVAGRPPGRPKENLGWFKNYVPIGDVQGMVYHHDRKIEPGDDEGLKVFLGKIQQLARNNTYRRVEVEIDVPVGHQLGSPTELTEYLADLCAPIGWTKNARLEGFTFIAER